MTSNIFLMTHRLLQKLLDVHPLGAAAAAVVVEAAAAAVVVLSLF